VKLDRNSRIIAACFTLIGVGAASVAIPVAINSIDSMASPAAAVTTSHGATANHPTHPASRQRYSVPRFPALCRIAGSGTYVVTFINQTSYPVDLTGFSVVYQDGSEETGSDTEPGNGAIDGVNTIGMNKWILVNKVVTFDVQPEAIPAGTTECTVVSYSR
jgi:hypothetical protein